MSIPWDSLPHVQNFLRLDFLFSGLEVSSTALFAARVLVFTLLAVSLIWAVLKIVLKTLECVQTFLASLTGLPGSFFLLLLLVVPLFPDSLGARWAGYILALLSLMVLAATAAVIVVLWKYGVDQAIRLINILRLRSSEGNRKPRESAAPPDNIVDEMGAPSTLPVKDATTF